MTNKKIFISFLIILFMIFTGHLWGEQRFAGGWIDSYNGPAKAYTLERSGEKIPVAIYMPVYLGDRIEVSQGHELIIGKSDGSILRIDHATGKYIIQKPDDSVTLLDNFLQWAGMWFGRYTDGEQNTKVTSMVSRWDDSPPISMSLFPTGQARMLPGRRTVSLYWDGGKPPFGLRMRVQDKSELVVNLEGLESGSVNIGPIDFNVGSYYLEVYDKDEIEIVRLDIVPEGLYPEKPAEMRNASMPGTVMNNLEAMWLAGQEEGVWVLEAYQMVTDTGNEQSAAALLRKALEEGVVLAR